MLVAPVWAIRSIHFEVSCSCLRHGMLMCVQKCAFGSYSMRHKHCHCQKRNHARKLLPDRRNLRADGQPFHNTGTLTGKTCSSVVPRAGQRITSRAPIGVEGQRHQVSPDRHGNHHVLGQRDEAQGHVARSAILRQPADTYREYLHLARAARNWHRKASARGSLCDAQHGPVSCCPEA